MNNIEVKNISRVYETNTGFFKKEEKTINALNDISFSAKKGEIFGLLGENGAGKTTLIKILITLLTPSSGKAYVKGIDVAENFKEVRPNINFIFGGELGIYKRLTAYENLLYFADLYKIDPKIAKERAKKLLDLVGLSKKADLKAETFSKGMLQKLQIARGLINDPEVIFLDEPTIGLDPKAAREFREVVKQLKSLGKTILLTTHYMYEADELCDRIAILKSGKIVELDTPENLKKRYNDFSVLETVLKSIENEQVGEIKKINGVDQVTIKEVNDKICLNIYYKANIASIMNNVLEALGEEIISLNAKSSTLEDVYIRIMEAKHEKIT